MRAKRINVTKVILGTLAVAGVLSVGLLAPNVLGAIAKLGHSPHKRQKEVISATQKRLVKKGLIGKKGKFIQLTSKGEQLLRLFKLKDFSIKKPKQWDKKWHLLIFDVPEKRKKTREQIRLTLESIGFVHLQDSVWLYPYDCEDLVTLLKADFRVGEELLYLVVERLEGDSYYKNYFKLF